MGKRWNGRKMSHGRKNLERPLKISRAQAVAKGTTKKRKKDNG